jgi:hypothetical protein
MDKTGKVADAVLAELETRQGSASGGSVSTRRRRTRSWKRLGPPLLRLSKTANRAAGVGTDPERFGTKAARRRGHARLRSR